MGDDLEGMQLICTLAGIVGSGHLITRRRKIKCNSLAYILENTAIIITIQKAVGRNLPSQRGIGSLQAATDVHVTSLGPAKL